MRGLLTVPFLVLIACDRGPTTGEEVIRAMHDRYAGHWFRTVTFTQDNTFYHPGDSVSHSQWEHAFDLPGKLRIDFLPFEQGNGIILRNDSQYVFQGGKLTSQGPRVLSLLLIAFDAYVIQPEKTIADLRKLGFRVDELHEESWQGRPTYVIGAKQGDLKSRQFSDRPGAAYAVRVIEPVDSTRVRDVQFSKYQPAGKGWIGPQVMMYMNGKPDRLEEYRGPVFDKPVDPILFDPAKWSEARKKS